MWMTASLENQSCDPFYLLIVGVVGYYSTWSHSLTQTQTHIDTLGRTPLGEGSARRRDIYLTTFNTHQETDIHAPGRIRTRKPRKRTAAYLCLNGGASGIAITNFKKHKLSIIHLKSNTNSKANLNFNILKLINLFDIDTEFRSRAIGSPIPLLILLFIIFQPQ